MTWEGWSSSQQCTKNIFWRKKDPDMRERDHSWLALPQEHSLKIILSLRLCKIGLIFQATAWEDWGDTHVHTHNNLKWPEIASGSLPVGVQLLYQHSKPHLSLDRKRHAAHNYIAYFRSSPGSPRQHSEQLRGSIIKAGFAVFSISPKLEPWSQSL